MSLAEVNVVSIARAIEYIEQNLREAITMAQIAEAACYSLYHFCRMFNSITHHTPYEYLMRRRLSEAARDLVDTDKKIIEIAFDYEFNSPETFARAFKRMFGVQPSQWRKQGRIPPRLLMPPLTEDYLRHLNQDDALKPVIIKKQAFQIVGLVTLVQHDLSIVSELWAMVRQELIQTACSENAGKYYGIVWYSENREPEGFFYMAGRESDSQKINCPVLVWKMIPAGQYVQVLHKGPWRDRRLSLDYLYHTWLPKSGKHLNFPLEMEVYDPKSEEWKQEDFALLLPLAIP